MSSEISGKSKKVHNDNEVELSYFKGLGQYFQFAHYSSLNEQSKKYYISTERFLSKIEFVD